MVRGVGMRLALCSSSAAKLRGYPYGIIVQPKNSIEDVYIKG